MYILLLGCVGKKLVLNTVKNKVSYLSLFVRIFTWSISF